MLGREMEVSHGESALFRKSKPRVQQMPDVRLFGCLNSMDMLADADGIVMVRAGNQQQPGRSGKCLH
ncbi:hypothetical protein D3C81_2014360 [compost metagenome]